MAQVTDFPKKQDDESDERVKQFTRAVQAWLDMFPGAERETAAGALFDLLRPVEVGPKQRSLPGAIVRLIPKGQEVTVEEICVNVAFPVYSPGVS